MQYISKTNNSALWLKLILWLYMGPYVHRLQRELKLKNSFLTQLTRFKAAEFHYTVFMLKALYM